MALPKKPYLVLSTVFSKSQACKIARVLVQDRLAACVNIVSDVDSIFRWRGKIDKACEQLLIIKTDERCLQKLRTRICSLHSYEVPEIIGWPIKWGHKQYLSWLSDSVSLR